MHGGHLMLTTTVGDVVTQVSLHGDTDTNRRLLQEVVQAITFVGPDKGTVAPSREARA